MIDKTLEEAVKTLADAGHIDMTIPPKTTPIRGFAGIEIDADMWLYDHEVTDAEGNTETKHVEMHKGEYLVKLSDGNKVSFDEPVMVASVVQMEMGDEDAADLQKDGTVSHEMQLRLIVTPEKIQIANGDPLTFGTLIARLAIKYAENDEERAKLSAIFWPQKQGTRPQKAYKVKVDQIVMPNDAITNALADRGANHIEPRDYMAGDWVTLPTGSKGAGMSVRVLIRNSYEIDAAFDDYQLSERDRFWHEAVVSLAEAGYSQMRISDIMKANGYKNPWSESCRPVMLDAYKSIRKMQDTRIAYDYTLEQDRRNVRRVPLQQAIKLQRIIDCDEIFEIYVDGNIDYEIELNVPAGGKPTDALKLYRYAADKGQIIRAGKNELEFDGKSLNIDHRIMWHYVYRRGHARHMSNTIRVDTLFRDCGIEIEETEAGRKKRKRLLEKLDSMLSQKKADGLVKSYKWSGRGHDEKVTIVWAEGSNKRLKTTNNPSGNN